MTSNEIRILAQTKSGLVISEPMGLTLVGEAIDLLALEYYLIGRMLRKDIEAAAEEEVELGDRLLKIISVAGGGKPLNANTDYEINNNAISFPESGTYTVKYYAEPIKPKVATDELQIPFDYQTCISYYVASVVRARLFGQDDSNAVSFYQQFENGALKGNNAYLRKKRSGKRIPPRR